MRYFLFVFSCAAVGMHKKKKKIPATLVPLLQVAQKIDTEGDFRGDCAGKERFGRMGIDNNNITRCISLSRKADFWYPESRSDRLIYFEPRVNRIIMVVCIKPSLALHGVPT